MASEGEYQQRLDQFGVLLQTIAGRLGSGPISDPTQMDDLSRQINGMLTAWEAADKSAPQPPDGGLAELAGVGPQAADHLSETRIPQGVLPYDDEVSSERVVAAGDLYYIFQHEKIGVFRAIAKLQELFRAGAVRLSSGDGALGLYQFDRRDVLRYTRPDRHAAYRRAFGYGRAAAPAGGRPNTEFHGLFTQFMNEVGLFWRDKRISDVMRERAYDPSFGSIAVVRRAGLDLRNNLKFMSFGHINVLRVELMQVLEEAFDIFAANDVRELFGAQTAWDVVEEILVRYFNESLATSPRQRMAVTGRDVLRWLARPYILDSQRAQFETQLIGIAESAEEWITSAQALGLAGRTGAGPVGPFTRVTGPAVRRPVSRPAARRRGNGRRPAPLR
jgi:hypothetical protein